MTLCSIVLTGAALVAQPLVDADVLEPSVQNEVDHALALASTNEVAVTRASVDFATLYATNSMTATERAISLVSSQKEGHWMFAGADVTPVAVRILANDAALPMPGARLKLPRSLVEEIARDEGKTAEAVAAQIDKLGFFAVSNACPTCSCPAQVCAPAACNAALPCSAGQQ